LTGEIGPEKENAAFLSLDGRGTS